VSAKWQPAVPAFYFFAFSTYWAVISTTFTNTLSAMGHIKTTLKLMVFWTAATWVLTPLLTIYFDFLGVAVSSFIISFTSVITIIALKRVLTIKVLNSVALPTAASTIMGVAVFFFAQNLVKDKLTLIAAIILGFILYALIIGLFAGKKVLIEIKSIRNA